MNKELINQKLLFISQQLSYEQIIHARRFRDWEEFDKLTQEQKLIIRLEELEIWSDDIDPNWKIKTDY
jgi:D-ribose pyranose/furanose isomerase RbsD